MISPAVEFEREGATIRVLVTSRETGGDYVICEVQATGPISVPMHHHTYEDQWIQVLKGEFQFEVGGQPSTVGPNGTIAIPRMTPCSVTGPEGGKLLIVARPGGLDLFIADARASLTAALPLPPVFEKHGIVLQ